MYEVNKPKLENSYKVITTIKHKYRIDNATLRKVILDSLYIPLACKDRASVFIWNLNRNDEDCPVEMVAEVTYEEVTTVEMPEPIIEIKLER